MNAVHSDLGRSKEAETLGRRDLVVVGAGPVGVAALWYARRRGLDALGVDTSAAPLTSIRAYMPELVLLSDAKAWEIGGLPLDSRNPAEITREDVLSYYSRIAAYGQMSFACRQRVVGIEPRRDVVHVVVETEDGPGTWLASRVLVTPWFRRRALSFGAERDTGVSICDPSKDVSVIGEEIVVVGGGLSGREACDRMIRRGARVTLLARSTRSLPSELAAIFEASGSRLVTAVTSVRVARRGVLTVETANGPSELPCTIVFNCTGQEIQHDLLAALRRTDLLSEAEQNALARFEQASSFDRDDLPAIAAKLPALGDAIWSGRRGVHFAGTIFHVGGIFGAGVLNSIDTARWAIAAMCGAQCDDAPQPSTHLPSFFLERGDTIPDRGSRWSDALEAIVPVPVPTWSRGTKVYERENVTGDATHAIVRTTRAIGEGTSEALDELRDMCWRGTSVAELEVELGYEREDLLWGLEMLWSHNGLTWIPPKQA